MSNPNPRQNPRGAAPRRSFKTLLPYILLFIVIGVVIWLAFFTNPVTTTTVTQDKILDYLTTNASTIKSITVTSTDRVTVIAGVFENGNRFLAKVQNSFYDNQVSALIMGTDGLGAQYTIEIIDAYERTFWNTIGPNLIYLVLFVIVIVFLYSRMAGAVNQSNSKAMEFNRSRARLETKIKKTFADVAGADAEKQEMMEIVDYLKNPKKYSQFGAKLPKGILLVGPPGTGKTLLAKAVAGEANVPFFSISGSDFVEMFVGVGAGRVRDMFQQAKKTAPCLIFIDELDAVGRQRGAGLGGGNDEREQTLNQLLIEMDGFADNSGIMVMAATNRDDVLDPALLRAGRFDRKITVSLPDRAGRTAIFKVHARGKVIDSSIDFDAISRRTVGFSGADIESILNDAAILAVRDKADKILLRHIDEAIDRRIAGPARSSKGLNEHERKVIAYHEAGHAIIGLNQPFSDKVQKITIIPRGRTGGHVLMTPEEDRFLVTKNELFARIVGYLGGRTSEEVFFEDVSTGAQNDIEVATRIARLMVTEFGMSDLGPIQYERDTGSVFLGRDYTSSQKNFSQQVALEIDKEVRKIIEGAHEKARELIVKHKEDLILIAETLLDRETITAEQIDTLLKERKLDEPKQVGIGEVVMEEPAKQEKVEKPEEKKE
ncbi:MAG: ATP-dependent zinc metalloprotease FtsH [Bacilli bacterium]|nr:ATP-dependent zinc metalloprotease FtsH [Bacilli bacterium]